MTRRIAFLAVTLTVLGGGQALADTISSSEDGGRKTVCITTSEDGRRGLCVWIPTT